MPVHRRSHDGFAEARQEVRDAQAELRLAAAALELVTSQRGDYAPDGELQWMEARKSAKDDLVEAVRRWRSAEEAMERLLQGCETANGGLDGLDATAAPPVN